MGRPSWPGPVGLDALFHPEPSEDSQVQLIVRPLYKPLFGQIANARDQHWVFQWTMRVRPEPEPPIVRKIEIVRERDLLGQGSLDHLTNWGSRIAPEDDTIGLRIDLKMMTRAERQALVNIADTTPVRVPDGDWNCQNWCKTVLTTAVREKIISEAEVARTIDRAENTLLAFR